MRDVKATTTIYVWGKAGLQGLRMYPNSSESPDLHVMRFSNDAYVVIRDHDAFREFAKRVNEYAATLPPEGTSKSAFKVGQRVTIFERPWSAEVEEGEATLVKLLDVLGDGAERWVVRFEDGEYERTIVPDEYQQKDPAERDWMEIER